MSSPIHFIKYCMARGTKTKPVFSSPSIFMIFVSPMNLMARQTLFITRFADFWRSKISYHPSMLSTIASHITFPIIPSLAKDFFSRLAHFLSNLQSFRYISIPLFLRGVPRRFHSTFPITKSSFVTVIRQAICLKRFTTIFAY